MRRGQGATAPASEGAMTAIDGALQCFWTFVDRCRSGSNAELRLIMEGGQLKANMCVALGPIRPESEDRSRLWPGLQKANNSQMRRRERRAAGRAAAAVAAGEAAAKKVAVVAFEEVIASAAAVKTTSKKVNAEEASGSGTTAQEALLVVNAEKASAKKVETEEVATIVAAKEATTKKADAEEAVSCFPLTSVKFHGNSEVESAEKAQSENDALTANVNSQHCDIAVTSCLGSKLTARENCWNCGETFSNDHQCDILPVKTGSGSGTFPGQKVCKQRPSPSAPVVLKKPVRMLDGSPAFPRIDSVK